MSVSGDWHRARSLFAGGQRAEALALLEKLAAQGEFATYKEIGQIYEIGGGGVAVDYEKAKFWYRKSAEEAEDAWGYYNLARLRCRLQESESWVEDAVGLLETIEQSRIAVAHMLLGHLLWTYPQVKDRARAIQSYRKAEALGNLVASQVLANCEIGSGQILRGVVRKVTAAVRVFFVAISNPRHEALRES